MITVLYKPAFIRQYNRCEEALKEEVLEKIELFKDKKNHKRLKVHHLKGRLKGRLSFSVNFKYRIVFKWKSKDVAVFLVFGDHDIYT